MLLVVPRQQGALAAAATGKVQVQPARTLTARQQAAVTPTRSRTGSAGSSGNRRSNSSSQGSRRRGGRPVSGRRSRRGSRMTCWMCGMARSGPNRWWGGPAPVYHSPSRCTSGRLPAASVEHREHLSVWLRMNSTCRTYVQHDASVCQCNKMFCDQHVSYVGLLWTLCSHDQPLAYSIAQVTRWPHTCSLPH
jgi:hypothetical protein